MNSRRLSPFVYVLCAIGSLSGCDANTDSAPAQSIGAVELSSVGEQTIVPITGAFGIELGSVFEHGDRPEKQGRYAFDPTDQYELLTEYTVSVTPEGRRVSSISAKGNTSSTYACSLERTILIGLLEDKYSAQDQIDRSSRRERSIMDGNRTISVRCDRSPRGKEFSVLSLMYLDAGLRQEAADELERPDISRSTDGL